MEEISKKADEKAEYSQYLSRMLDELCISQIELAKAVGRSQKSVSRYVLGESLPDEKTREAIGKFLQEQSVYKGFHHMPSEEFAQLLRRLFIEFREKITQDELAGKIGRYQKDISRYLYLESKPDTKTQYDILMVFYGMCRVNPIHIASSHTGTGFYLKSLLEKNDFMFADSFREELPRIGEPAQPGEFVQCCMALPYEMQKLIVENFDAFYDNYCYPAKGIVFSFGELAAAMDFFRRLSREGQKKMQDALEKDAFVGFGYGRERLFFRQITAYHRVILADPASLMQYDGQTCDMQGIKHADGSKNEREEILECLEGYVSLCYQGNKKMTEQLKYKLSFTQDEWYLWMLFLIHCYKGKDLRAMIEETMAD